MTTLLEQLLSLPHCTCQEVSSNVFDCTFHGAKMKRAHAEQLAKDQARAEARKGDART